MINGGRPLINKHMTLKAFITSLLIVVLGVEVYNLAVIHVQVQVLFQSQEKLSGEDVGVLVRYLKYHLGFWAILIIIVIREMFDRYCSRDK